MLRPILVVIIGYILGIIWGLYFKISIVYFYIFIIAIYFLFKIFLKSIFFNKSLVHKEKSKKLKLFSIKRYFRYIKLILNLKMVIVIIIFSIISNSIIMLKENRRKNIQNYLTNIEEVKLYGIIVKDVVEKEYTYQYEVKVNIKKEGNKYFYITVNKEKAKFKFGDKIYIEGKFLLPNSSRNYMGFDYNNYLKQENILGTIKVQNIKLIKEKQENKILSFFNKISNDLKTKIKTILPEDVASLTIGILLNDMSNIDEKTKENFNNANLSHILAVSGTHMTYIMIGLAILLNKIIGKRKTFVISIIAIIFYYLLIGFSASVARASIMGIMVLFSKIIYKKVDLWTSISLSLLIILIYNPYLILNLGLQFSYLGTIGIIIFNNQIQNLLMKKIKNIKRYKYYNKNKELKIIAKIIEIISVTISANLFIIPITIFSLNTLNIYFIITNLLVSIIIEPLMIICFIFLVILFINLKIAQLLGFFVTIGIKLLLFISKIGQMPFSKVYVITPKLYILIIYFIVIFIFNFYYSKIIMEKPTNTAKRFKNIVSYLKYKIFLIKKQQIKKVIIVLLVTNIIFFLFIKPQISNLKIYFLDVGQGDSTFIITPKNKTILIDGGGTESLTFDVGKKVLIPYILDRGYKTIDLVIISHFDTDHVGGILTLLEELEVKKVCISKQYEKTKNYEKFLKIVSRKKIDVQVLIMGDILRIEDNLIFEVLFPEKELIKENSINNNSLVMKLKYKDFKMLFTGDIETLAEERLVNIYKNTKKLESDILKVAHHGSKTSTSQEFLNLVCPKIALIGVGKDNTFGHPSKEILQRLENFNVKIYRTDENGEIKID